MKEFITIVAEYAKIDFSKRKAALATVVKVYGSSYRSPGARMLITDDGRWVGSISGGCLEGDALRKARQVMLDQKPLTVTYDTREESNQNLGIGLGCNGVIDVLIEPLDPLDKENPIHFFDAFLKIQQPLVLATIFSSEGPLKCIAEKALLTEMDEQEHFKTIPTLFEMLKPDMVQAFNCKRSEAKVYCIDNTKVEVFIELIQPLIQVVIFGGGFDARPVSELAKKLGWAVTVTDECIAHIAPAFFPGVDRLTLCDRKLIEKDFNITPYTACILMSHNYEYDRDVLKKIIKSETPYIGILGPRKRFEKMKEELNKEEGIILTQEDSHRIHSPIGLDIGAETPDEIAVSIIGEIQSKFANRSGGFLKYRSSPIHERDPQSGQLFKQIYIRTEESKPSQAQ